MIVPVNGNLTIEPLPPEEVVVNGIVLPHHKDPVARGKVIRSHYGEFPEGCTVFFHEFNATQLTQKVWSIHRREILAKEMI